MSDDIYRCPSIGMMPVGPAVEWPRCSLPNDHGNDHGDGHGDGHEGVWRGRTVLWDFSSVNVSDESPDRWVPA